MIRFSASEPELLGLLRFLDRRARRLIPMDAGRRIGSLLFVPLVGTERDYLRPRKTPRALMTEIRATDNASLWGVRLAADANQPYTITRDVKTGKLVIDPETSRLIVLAFGPVIPDETHTEAAPQRRREGLIEVRDWTIEEPPAPEVEDEISATPATPVPKGVVLLPQTVIARDLVERCARRLRRRGALVGNRWHVPPDLPEDEEADAEV